MENNQKTVGDNRKIESNQKAKNTATGMDGETEAKTSQESAKEQGEEERGNLLPTHNGY